MSKLGMIKIENAIIWITKVSRLLFVLQYNIECYAEIYIEFY